MIDATALKRPKVANAYRTLYLLPGAPRELIDAAYELLARNGAAPDVRAAYETIVATLEPMGVEQFPRRLSPWHLLHLQPNAPQPLFAAAYHIWLGGAEPPELRTPAPKVEANFRSPPGIDPGEPGSAMQSLDPNATVAAAFRSPPSSASEVAPVPEAFVSAFEELGENQQDISSIGKHLEPAAAQDAHVFAFEELARDERSGDLQVAATEAQQALALDEKSGPSAGSGPEVDRLALISNDGEARDVTDRPLRIGTQPSCDVLVQAAVRFEARVWRNKGRVLVHALGEPGAVLVNGANVTWAVLSDGDTLAVGPVPFTFRVNASG